MHKSCKDTTLWLLSATRFGGLAQAACAIGVHPITLYRAANGASVSKETRRRIEHAFSQPLEVLRMPVAQAIEVLAS